MCLLGVKAIHNFPPELPPDNKVVTAPTPILDFWHYGSVG